TLTGAIITALGSTYAGLFSNDDALSEALAQSSLRTGELTWRLPLHPDYKELTRGKVADLVNVSEQRKASSAYAASFLEEFVDDRRATGGNRLPVSHDHVHQRLARQT